MKDIKTDGMWLMQGDCLERMKEVPDGSVDMVLTDPPYGTTACKWDTVIPFEPLWAEYKRIIKKNGAIVLFGAEPFSSHLRLSNLDWFKYDWVWKKNEGSGFAISKYQPMRYHEMVHVFSEGRTPYYPIKTDRNSDASKKACKKPIRSGAGKSEHVTGLVSGEYKLYDSEFKNPESVLEFKSVPNGGGNKLHPTQKPVALCEYLIKTYTNEGEWVLDNCMGSCTTGVAAVNTGRNFIGIELDDKYFNIAKERINNV